MQLGNTAWEGTGRSGGVGSQRRAGPGARGIVFGARGSNVGHVFNGVNQNGTIRFLDGQTGTPANSNGFTGLRFLWTYRPTPLSENDYFY